jgi:hypothetical protein
MVYLIHTHARIHSLKAQRDNLVNYGSAWFYRIIVAFTRRADRVLGLSVDIVPPCNGIVYFYIKFENLHPFPDMHNSWFEIFW